MNRPRIWAIEFLPVRLSNGWSVNVSGTAGSNERICIWGFGAFKDLRLVSVRVDRVRDAALRYAYSDDRR